MSEKIDNQNPEEVGVLSIVELRKFPSNEYLKDEELQKQAILLKEFSMILYQAYIIQASQQNEF
jgi:hypothetical protein